MEITMENVREHFEELVNKLNLLNDFCIKNEITFSIDAKSSYISSNFLYPWDTGFELRKLTQTTIKKL